jgi:hypothetical protein
LSTETFISPTIIMFKNQNYAFDNSILGYDIKDSPFGETSCFHLQGVTCSTYKITQCSQTLTGMKASGLRHISMY